MKMRYRFALAAVTFVSLMSAITIAADESAATRPEMTAAAASIREDRSKDILPSKFPMGDQGNLHITLRVTGSDADHATAWGKIKIDKAQDDAGENLIPDTHMTFGNPDDMTTIDPMQTKMRHDIGEEGFDVTIDLKGAKRSARSLAVVGGSFLVRSGGTEQTASFTNLPALGGKSMDDPALKTAGVTATIVSAVAQSTTVKIDFGGNLAAIREVHLLDTGGNNMDDGNSMMTMMGTEHAEYSLSAPLDANMKLQVKLISGQKEITVPFEVQSVPLP